MKKRLIKTIATFSFLLSLIGTTVYAANYRFNPERYASKNAYIQDIMDNTQFHQYLSAACTYWTQSAANVSIWETYGSSYNQIRTNTTSSSTREGDTYPYTAPDGSTAFFIDLYTSNILRNNTRNSSNYNEAAIVHEIGHIFGLADLNYLDTHQAIMSYYNDRYVRYTPQPADIEGVNKLYP